MDDLSHLSDRELLEGIYRMLMKPKRAQRRSEAVQNGYSDAFTAFWIQYPRHVGKPAAWRAWKALSDEQRENALAVMPDWRRAWQDTEVKFIPHASTWLNQWRFDDPVEQAVPEQKERLDKLDNHELDARAQKMGINTVGLSRYDIIDRIQTR